MDKQNRRSFIKKAMLVGGGVYAANVIPASAIYSIFPKRTDISVVEGSDPYVNTEKALSMLGGMDKFVKKGQKVGLLINSDFTLKGVYTSPDVSLAVIKACFEAGASEIRTLQNVKPEYWERSPRFGDHKEMLDLVKNTEYNQFPSKFHEDYYLNHHIPEAQGEKDMEVLKYLFEIDVLINLPISKHHPTTNVTCNIKNMMGLTTRATNVKFHLNGREKNDPEYFGTCIAELTKVRVPDLCVVDSTEFIVTGGPVGPGEIQKANKVVIGKDPVAVDTYCAGIMGYTPEEVPGILQAEKIGVGTSKLQRLKIREKCID